MKTLGIAALLVLLAGALAQVNFRQPICDSPEAEEAAFAARDYLNGQHAHGYKYELNRIEDIKVYPGLNGEETYVLEVDLLETDCHVLDPTPLANCTVRPKILTAVEGDCEVVLNKAAGALSVTAFKCKTDESTEDLCLGCQSLLPLNHTAALDFVHTTLETFNNNSVNTSYTILEVGRMSTQLVSGGPMFLAEYVINEANCTAGNCVPLVDPLAVRGICTAKGVKTSHSVQCKMFPIQMMPVVDANGTATVAPLKPPVLHVPTGTRRQGLGHHKLTSFHNPHMSGHLSAESPESAEVVHAAPAGVADAASGVTAPVQPDDSAADSSTSRDVPVVVFKRDVSNDAEPLVISHIAETGPALFIPRCPGMIRYFD